MKGFLLDTNICIYLLKGAYNLQDKIESAGISNCYLSEITVAELKFGAENSQNPVRNRAAVRSLLETFTILPIFDSLDVYASEKARLRKKGQPLDDFDLLIGASAIANDLTLVTRNVSDFDRLQGIVIENWAVQAQER